MGDRLSVFAVMGAVPRWFVPHSLRMRMILLILGSVLLTQAATLITVSYFRQKFIEDVAIGYVVTTIRTLRSALSQVPADERADFVRAASQNQWRLWSRGLPAEARLQRLGNTYRRGGAAAKLPNVVPEEELRAEREEREAARVVQRILENERWPRTESEDMRQDLRGLIELLNERLNDGTRVALSYGQRPEIFISLASNLAGEEEPRLREWLVIPLDRLDPPVTTPFIVAWLGGLGLLLLLAVGFSWSITRPITRLAVAADRLAAGQPKRVVPSGPHETRVLSERFNAMLDALAESESVRRTLLAGLPHDLKGPLSRMWLRIELTEDAQIKEGLRADLQEMQHMVDQFIGFVRGTDPAAYHYAPLLLSEWLDERVQTWKGAGTDIRLTHLEQTVLTVRADAIALGRLLDNLIANALNHGAPPVELRLYQEGRWAVLEVADHGPGIAPERRDEALRPFSRLDEARTRTGSVGLGLALAEAIARAHGGSLALRQAAVGGLCVCIKLPLLEAA